MTHPKDHIDALLIDVLLVEDSAEDRELSLETIRASGLAPQVHVARDGVEALEMLRGRPGRPAIVPRLVMLDLKLPRMDGLDLLAAMRADERLRRLPVVLLSTSSRESDVARAYDQGANSYVVKPGDGEQFARTIQAIAQYWLTLNRTAA